MTKMTSTSKFYDTCSLLKKVDKIFENENEKIYISSITLKELENIKTSSNKDAEVKYASRKLIHLLDENEGKYEIIVFQNHFLSPIEDKDLPITDDTKILSCAVNLKENRAADLIFVTNDLALKNIAKIYFNKVESVDEEYDDGYTGYIKADMNDESLAVFYSYPEINTLNLLVNQYALLYDKDGKHIDTVYWDGSCNQRVAYNTFNSEYFGKVKPYTNDPYQLMLFDSLKRNKITVARGPAGSGKSYCAIGYLMHMLEKGKIDRIIVFCNTVATKDAAQLGFYPGDREMKLLDSQIGNMLIAKLGGRMAVEQMLMAEELLLLPMSDIRGFDTSGMKAGVYITEAQNLSINLMKLALQRIGEDSICIIDGDDKTQVDSLAFAGANNGMKRVSKIFRGEDLYGEVELGVIHRSRIANIADRL